jgi:beta-glucosidase
MRLSGWAIGFVAMLAVLAGCGLGPASERISMSRESVLARSRGVPGAELAFPQGFLWGVSMAGYQVEGGDTTSNWAEADRQGRLRESPGKAIDFWNRYASDFELARGMGMSSVRLSIEWSRIEPTRGQIDPIAVQRYHDMIKAVRDRGMEPLVTLSHFAYPGWLDRPLDGKEGG